MKNSTVAIWISFLLIIGVGSQASISDIEKPITLLITSNVYGEIEPCG